MERKRRGTCIYCFTTPRYNRRKILKFIYPQKTTSFYHSILIINILWVRRRLFYLNPSCHKLASRFRITYSAFSFYPLHRLDGKQSYWKLQSYWIIHDFPKAVLQTHTLFRWNKIKRSQTPESDFNMFLGESKKIWTGGIKPLIARLIATKFN